MTRYSNFCFGPGTDSKYNVIVPVISEVYTEYLGNISTFKCGDSF